jgi:hypothetical protein
LGFGVGELLKAKGFLRFFYRKLKKSTGLALSVFFRCFCLGFCQWRGCFKTEQVLKQPRFIWERAIAATRQLLWEFAHRANSILKPRSGLRPPWQMEIIGLA